MLFVNGDPFGIVQGIKSRVYARVFDFKDGAVRRLSPLTDNGAFTLIADAEAALLAEAFALSQLNVAAQ